MASRPWRRRRSRDRSGGQVWFGLPGRQVPTMRGETASLQSGQGQAVLIRTQEQPHATPRVQVNIPTPMHSARETNRKERVGLARAGSLAKAASAPDSYSSRGSENFGLD